MDFLIIIPARYAASRLPAKLLQDIHGKPLIQHTYENALKSDASEVIIATDDVRIEALVKNFGAKVCLTNVMHQSGTQRIGEALEILGIDDKTVIVNVQGDEPMLDARVINQVAKNLMISQMKMATICEEISHKNQYLDPNCVKVVFNESGKALYFSRAPIPAFREAQDFDKSLCFKHVGLYAYQAGFVKKLLKLPCSRYEQVEKLEQLSALNAGYDIHVARACATTGVGVDTQKDLDEVRGLLR
jgi:3-deoxy-manno-octulosonate cytidylyltransferase (CMP-KDO synthetase)